MFSLFSKRSRGRWVLATGVAAAAVGLLAGCSGGGTSGGSSDAKADTISYALPSNTQPNWILPLQSPGHQNTNNLSISGAMWENLVAYDGASGKVQLDTNASLADKITYAPDNKSVTIQLRKESWSDGKPVTSRDVEFFYNLIKANTSKWASYTKGKAPDNWTSFTVVDDQTFTIDFDKAYNSDWMTANELSLIVPIPQHAWDKTSNSGTVGDLDTTPAGAQKVFDYLTNQSKDIQSYATNPLWKTVDGPYGLSAFTNSGQVTLTANKKYDGKDAAHIGTVKLLPFTTSEAEENSLRSGSLDYGYISAASLSNKSQFTSKGYTVQPWNGWSITYMPYNFNNPTMGPVFKQLYARQAVQMSIDQTSLSKVVWNGTAQPDYGPVPQSTASDFVSPDQTKNPYPFDTSAAKKLLTAHGWTIGSDGVAECTSAGSGASQCGDGVAQGTKFAMTVLSQSGSDTTDNMMTAIQSSLQKTGIKFTIKSAPVNSVLSQTAQCKPTDASCNWQLSFFGTAGSWYFPAYPTGESLFATGGGANFGSYSDPETDKLISASQLSSDNSVIQQYSALLAKQLPVVWMPNPDYQISVVKKGLTGIAQDSLANFHPQRWTWSK